MDIIRGFDASGFEWLHHPVSHWKDSIAENAVLGETEGTGGNIVAFSPTSLVFQPPAKKDFWSRTFYTPLLIKHDASGFLYPIPSEKEVTVQLSFRLQAVEQFDQAGILVYLDSQTWIKAGIEFCDDIPRLSTVVCNNGFADWATQIWTDSVIGAHLRITKVSQSSSVVIEVAPLNSLPTESTAPSTFHMVRIAHLEPTNSTWRIGPFAASPIAQRGCQAEFWDFQLGPRQSTVHNDSL